MTPPENAAGSSQRVVDPRGFAGQPYDQQPKGIDPAFLAPVVYPPVKCPDCGTWWRTATHKCVDWNKP